MWLRTAPLIAAALALAGCADTGPEQGAVYNSDGSVTITVGAARVAECKQLGGCALYSQGELEGLAEAAAEAGAQSCKRHAPSSL